MRRYRATTATRFLFVALIVLAAPCLLSAGSAAEDVEVSTTFLTFFKNGGGYIEYHVNGRTAADLRTAIDDPATRFPFETALGDGDGIVDQYEGEQYMQNLDDLLTRRQIVLRGVKMHNVDVDDHRGLIGSGSNDTREIYLHITFRGELQYDRMEFNVSGLEPVMVLFGDYVSIPPTMTVEERTYIVSAGTASYSVVTKGEGSLWNLRIPLGAVVSYHESYTVSSVPSNRMEYDHSTVVANPLVLMIFMFIVTIVAIKVPKTMARSNRKERVRELHLAILVGTVLVWSFYVLGGAAVLVWVLGIALVAGSVLMGHQVYAREWRGLAMDMEGIDLGEAITAADPVNGTVPPAGPAVQGPALLADAGPRGIERHPSEDVVVALPDDLHPPEPVDVPPYVNVSPQGSGARAPPAAVPPIPGTKNMRCRCGGLFQVPIEPRPLEVQCPHCGTTGVLR